MTFGTIKSTIEKILIDSYSDEQIFKKTIKEFKSYVLNNTEFLTIYDLYTQLSTPQKLNESDAKEFLEEGVKLIKNKLKEVTLPKRAISNNNNEYSDIDTLVYGTNNILETVKAKRRILETLVKYKVPAEPYDPIIKLPISSQLKIAEQTFKQYLRSIPDDKRTELMELFKVGEPELKTQYEKNKSITLSKLRNYLNESDSQTKTKINETIEKLRDESFNYYNYVKLKNLISSI